MNLTALRNHAYVRNLRLALGHLAVGLTYAWWILFLLELWRPGLLSWYLNLNLLLGLALTAWLLGATPVPSPAPVKQTYVNPAISVILVVGVAVALTTGSSVVLWAPVAALLTVLLLWRIFPRRT